MFQIRKSNVFDNITFLSPEHQKLLADKIKKPSILDNATFNIENKMQQLDSKIIEVVFCNPNVVFNETKNSCISEYNTSGVTVRTNSTFTGEQTLYDILHQLVLSQLKNELNTDNNI